MTDMSERTQRGTGRRGGAMALTVALFATIGAVPGEHALRGGTDAGSAEPPPAVSTTTVVASAPQDPTTTTAPVTPTTTAPVTTTTPGAPTTSSSVPPSSTVPSGTLPPAPAAGVGAAPGAPLAEIAVDPVERALGLAPATAVAPVAATVIVPPPAVEATVIAPPAPAPAVVEPAPAPVTELVVPAPPVLEEITPAVVAGFLEWLHQFLSLLDQFLDSLAAAAAPPGYVDLGNGVFGPSHLLGIRRCESGDNYEAVSRTGSFRGAYQFVQRTWNAVAARNGRHDLVGVRPNETAPADQDQMAVWNYEQANPWKQWPVCARRR